jgi:hypothetical protein
MDIINLFKAQKLTITAVNVETTGEGKEQQTSYSINEKKVFKAMFNPSEYSTSHQANWDHSKTITPKQKQALFKGHKYSNFNVTLILDGTGASEFGLTTGFGLVVKSVKERVQEFLILCYYIEENLHSPNKIQVKWGDFSFIGHLESVTIKYTLFDNSGNPLRAELNTSFFIEQKSNNLSSPDLTHYREVHEGDTLPLLSREIYGTSRHYLLIAEANKLDDFRQLKAGTKLYFPPLESQR